MRDTFKKIERRYREMMMSKIPLERLRMVSRMYDGGRKLALSGIKHAENLDAEQLRMALFLRMYGADFSVDECRKIVGGINIESIS
ncbi:MAG: hypothetical protein GXO96_08875 [Nitrospirae bacterium]|nr:hypothetical protein [Candidatus Manganitrophaceae bacterium]